LNASDDPSEQRRCQQEPGLPASMLMPLKSSVRAEPPSRGDRDRHDQSDRSAPPVNGVLSYFTTLDRSLMEQLQSIRPDARFVKAFNSVGNGRMVNPAFADGQPTMFICGNDEEARRMVAGICEQFGWDVQDLGMAEAARAIEPLCILWCIPGFLGNEWTHAFKVVHK
jgi:hypothetical protein